MPAIGQPGKPSGFPPNPTGIRDYFYISRRRDHGGGNSRLRGAPQSAPHFRETGRLADGLQPADLRRPAVLQPGVVGFRVQLVRGAADPEEAAAHPPESGGEGAPQVSLPPPRIEPSSDIIKLIFALADYR